MHVAGVVSLAVLALGACKEPPPTPSEVATAHEEDPLEISTPKDYVAEVDDASLGTLPDGVGLAVGTRAPDFEARDAAGETVTLDALLAKGGDTLLVFYRGGW